MDVSINQRFVQQPEAQDAAEIIRKCVHCGFCTATCPTYQLLGDESDSPRGRIYLIRQLLEKGGATIKTRTHLDRCLLCRACETTCPSGVQYGQLIEYGRQLLEQVQPRPKINTLRRKTVAKALVQGGAIKTAVKLGIKVREWLPDALNQQLPDTTRGLEWPTPRHARKMLVLAGCVQPALSPETNAKAARVLDRLGISLLQEDGSGCCGAVGLHTSDPQMGMRHIRERIDQWWPQLENGVEGIIFTASGCGVTIKDYAHLLKDDTDYAEKAVKVSAMARDLSEVVLSELDQLDADIGQNRKIAFHPPCTLQHGLKLNGVVEKILTSVGYDLLPVSDSHLCCGSAGTYSLFQPELSGKLKQNKLKALQAHQPELIATANIGCQQHLKTGTRRDVVHWIQLL